MAGYRSFRRNFASPNFEESTGAPIVKLWLLRILLRLNGWQGFISSNKISHKNLAEALDIGEWLFVDMSKEDVSTVLDNLHSKLAKAEKKADQLVSTGYLQRNIAGLVGLIGLNRAEQKILEFSTLVQCEYFLEDALGLLGHLGTSASYNMLSVLLDLPLNDVRAALSENNRLYKTGMVRLNQEGSFMPDRKASILSHKFPEYLYSTDGAPIELLRDVIKKSTAAELGLDDFEHIAEETQLLKQYLSSVLQSVDHGVNILLHGKPGTGKNQLVKALAECLSTQLFEVTSEDSSGYVLGGRQRLQAYQAAQYFMQEKPTLIMFDEIEDIFSNTQGGNIGSSKAWFNRLLEENTVPSIWLSNSTRHIDSAFIRRFDMVVKLEIPPRKQRLKILESACANFYDKDVISRLANSSDLAPALVSRAAKVVQAIHQSATQASTPIDASVSASAFERIVTNTLTTQGHRLSKALDANALPSLYNPDYINADVDIAQLATGLASTRAGRLCLYGPPGTGKTAYGRWIAEQLDAPLVVKRASDLMSPWAGQCEINIARAFSLATSSGSVLLIDEVDSFLQDRRGQSQSWQIAWVNEMLTQIESFAGVFIASTNLMAGLDQAALRRFDMKVKFDFMRLDQCQALFNSYCQLWQLDNLDARDSTDLNRLTNVTPGDFATIARKHRIAPLNSARDMLQALSAECALKEGNVNRIGFGP